MSDPVVLCSHLPGEGYFHSDRFRVVDVECRDPYAYWAGLAAYWEDGPTIVNIEHDLAVSDDHIQALLDCSCDLCAWAYECHWVTTHLPTDVIAAGTGADRDVDLQPDAYYLQGGEEWAAWSAIGFVKITRKARTGTLARKVWGELELAVEAAVARPWHMHGNSSDGWSTDLPDVVHHHW